MPDSAPAGWRALAHDTLCLLPSPLLKYQRGGQFVRQANFACSKSGAPGPSFNFVAALLSPLPTLKDILPVAEAVFGTDRSSYGVLVEGDHAEPLESELKQNGYRIFEDEPAFVRPTLDDIKLQKHPLTIRQGKSLEDFHTYGQLVTKIFQSPPELIEQFFPSESQADPEIFVFLGELAGEPVTSVCYMKTGAAAHVAGTATLESERGKGYGAALVLHALADAHQRGCTAAALRSGPLSIPLYKRLGFHCVCQHRTYALPSS